MNKKDIKKASQDFVKNVDEIVVFARRCKSASELSDQDESWAYDLAIIRVYREFEDLMLSCLITLINRDSSTFSAHKDRDFPKHMSVAVCEYLICGDGYFDFSGRPGLIRTIKKVVPDGNWFLNIVRDATYTDALDKLSALRNFAAHDSAVSKKRALEAIGHKRMSSSGAWLKKQNRLDTICASLKTMAQQIEVAAPF